MRQFALATILTLSAAAPALAQRDGDDRALSAAANALRVDAWEVRTRISDRDVEVRERCTSLHDSAVRLIEVVDDRGNKRAVERLDDGINQEYRACERGTRRLGYHDDANFMRRWYNLERSYKEYARAYRLWNRGGDGGRGDTIIVRCSSNDEKYRRCEVDGRIESVAVENRISDNDCVEGRSWGYDRSSIWVDRGCRADFRVRLAGRRDR